MNTAFLPFIGVFIRFLYIRFYKKQKVNLIELWKRTRFGDNLEYINISNRGLGFIAAGIITLIILLVLHHKSPLYFLFHN